MLYVLKYQRQDAYEDNENQDYFYVLLDEFDISQEVSGERYQSGPEHGADETKDDKLAEVHFSNTCNCSDESAHYRHKACHDNRTGSVLLEEGMGLVDIFLLEESRVRAFE